MGFISSHAAAQSCPASEGAWVGAFDHPIGSANGETVCVRGAFEQYVPTQLDAIHMSLIPKGPKRGWVIVWGGDHAYHQPTMIGGSQVQRGIYYGLIDPLQPIGPNNPRNFCEPLPPGMGDLFCAGHAWNANGDLLVIGGTECHVSHPPGSQPCPTFTGSLLAYVWQPPQTSNPNDGGKWFPIGSLNPAAATWLDQKRWYPSVLALGPRPAVDDDPMMVAGGLHPVPQKVNSYEVWLPDPSYVGGQWQDNPANQNHTFPGPTFSGGELGNYPRILLLSASIGVTFDPVERARVFMAGMDAPSDRVSHYNQPGLWQNGGWTGGSQIGLRKYGSAVLLPVLLPTSQWDRVLSLGGLDILTIHDSVQLANAAETNVVWQNEPSLATGRWLFNTVLLPDTRVLVVGGEAAGGSTSEGCSKKPALTPEIYDMSDSAAPWSNGCPHSIIRDYHSTALLLPTGEVLVGGGEYRRFMPEPPLQMSCGENSAAWNKTPLPAGTLTDYNIYRPSYLTSGGTQLTIAPPAGLEYDFAFGTTVPVGYSGLPGGVTIERVVLMRPGSVTHHFDTNQRCVELNFTHSDMASTLNVTVTSKDKGTLPRGYYMMFFVTSEGPSPQGVPSTAAWVLVR